MRLDLAVAARHPDISRRRARSLIAEHRVLVNDRPVAVASREVSEKDRIAVVADVPDLEILRETEAWVAVNKPSGMPAQPARDRKDRSLEELLRVRYGNIFVVHRIDRPTSGVVLYARTSEGAAHLSSLFMKRVMRKTYLAVVEGAIDHEITIESPVGGRDAHTIVRPLRRDAETTLVAAEILTGRMHQIRIHLKSIERPVLGDRRYGSSMNAPRLMLHAFRIEHEDIGLIEAPPPVEFGSL